MTQPATHRRSVVAICGNPRTASRTSAVAQTLASAVADLVDAPTAEMIELSELATEIFAEPRPAVDAALDQAAGATVLVVATPTYKATYTGLLKSFLDLYRGPGLRGVTAVPVQLAGDPGHLLAAEVHLRPLLVELGASVPTRAFMVSEAELDSLNERLSAWLDCATPAFTSLAASE
jgi:FMN reductase